MQKIELPTFQMQFLDENTKRKISVAANQTQITFLYNQCESANFEFGGSVTTCKYHSKEDAIKKHYNCCPCGRTHGL